MDHFKNSIIGLFAGLNGGIATVYVGQPLDTIKVKMQAFPEVYSNAWRCFRVTLVKDGIAKGLYAGTVPALVANVAENSILFCALPPCQLLVGRLFNKGSHEHLSDLQHAFAGSLAGFWSSLALCPTELVKCKVQSMREMAEFGQIHLKPSEIGPWSVTKSIYRERGLRGFTCGLSATFAREMPGYFFFFGGYEASRSFLARHHGHKNQLNSFETAVCGGVAGCALWTAVFPFDVVKSRMQIGHFEACPTPACTASSPSVSSTRSSGQPLSSVPNSEQQNMFRLLIRIARHEGFRALYRGLGPTLLRTFPASGALFVAVEWTRKFGLWLLNPKPQ